MSWLESRVKWITALAGDLVFTKGTRWTQITIEAFSKEELADTLQTLDLVNDRTEKVPSAQGSDQGSSSAIDLKEAQSSAAPFK